MADDSSACAGDDVSIAEWTANGRRLRALNPDRYRDVAELLADLVRAERVAAASMKLATVGDVVCTTCTQQQSART